VSADKDQQESRVVAEKPNNAVVKFNTYGNLQQHRVVRPAISWLLLLNAYATVWGFCSEMELK